MGNSKPTILGRPFLISMNFSGAKAHNLAQLGTFSQGREEEREYAPYKTLFLSAFFYGKNSIQPKLKNIFPFKLKNN